MRAECDTPPWADRADPPFLRYFCSRLYVGSLNFALTENDIRQVFQPFGPVEVVDLHKDPVTGKSKGYAFVQCVPPFCAFRWGRRFEC